MPARATRANPYTYDPRAETTAEREVYLLLGSGDADFGRQLFAFWASWFLPEPPEGIVNGWGRWLPKDGWMRFGGSRPPWTAILAHFRGQLALGGVYVRASRVLVLHADNQTGKRIIACGTPLRGEPIWRDADLGKRPMNASRAGLDRGRWGWQGSGPATGGLGGRRRYFAAGHTNVGVVRPAKAGAFSGRQTRRGKSQEPRSLDDRQEGNRLI